MLSSEFVWRELAGRVPQLSVTHVGSEKLRKCENFHDDGCFHAFLVRTDRLLTVEPRRDQSSLQSPGFASRVAPDPPHLALDGAFELTRRQIADTSLRLDFEPSQ